jgi:16S rRNA (cytosine1402-N4)-methyltransferase
LTFTDDTQLDMRLSPDLTIDAAQILNRNSEKEIADLLYLYGDRHNSRTLARKIIKYRRNKSFRLAQDLKEAIGLWRPQQIAPIFQALRIAVNQEYQELQSALPQAISLLAKDGVLAIISFHSGEDRIVKHILRRYHELIEVNKSIIRPSLREIKQNPRSRSAVLRIAKKR